jgi:hypothetical protein
VKRMKTVVGWKAVLENKKRGDKYVNKGRW